ncbi:hypothetical protein J4437_00835 [Candidatus Woesearchaeota archaeon]|nr:hypothetical protein [Candidatus Woesearchaeota archaeon]
MVFKLDLPKVPLEKLVILERNLVKYQQDCCYLSNSKDIFFKDGIAKDVLRETCEELASEGIEAKLVNIKEVPDNEEVSEYNEGWCIRINDDDTSNPINGPIILRQLELAQALVRARWVRLTQDYENTTHKLGLTTQNLLDLSTFNSLVQFSEDITRCKIYLYYNKSICETVLDSQTEKYSPLTASSKPLLYFTKTGLSKYTASHYFKRDHQNLNVFFVANPSAVISAVQLLNYAKDRVFLLYQERKQ